MEGTFARLESIRMPDFVSQLPAAITKAVMTTVHATRRPSRSSHGSDARSPGPLPANDQRAHLRCPRRCRSSLPTSHSATGGLTIQSDRKEELHQVALLCGGEVETEQGIVVIHDVVECRKPTVVIETSLLVSPQASQG